MKQKKRWLDLLLPLTMTVGCFALNGSAVATEEQIETVEAGFSILSIVDRVEFRRKVDADGNMTKTTVWDIDKEKYGFVMDELSAISTAKSNGELDENGESLRLAELSAAVQAIQAQDNTATPYITPERQITKVYTVTVVDYDDTVLYSADVEVVGTYSDADNSAIIDRVTVVSESGEEVQYFYYQIDMTDCMNGNASISFFNPLVYSDEAFHIMEFHLSQNGNLRCNVTEIYK